MLLVVFLVGMFVWTLTEYLLHRFLGHVHKGKNFFKAEHLMHHSKANYFASGYKKVVLALLVSTMLVLLLNVITSFTISVAFVLGYVSMYALYEVTHKRFHQKTPIAKPFIILRKHHFYHHFHNPKTNHGVTTRIWDRVFGTFKRVEHVDVPRQMSMKWLVEENEIKLDYTKHFKFK